MSMFPVIVCLTVPLDIYQCYSVLRGEREQDGAVLHERYLKGLHPSSPTHTITFSSLACRTCSGACNRNTMSNVGENSQAKLSMSSPASGCEILDLTSSPLMEGTEGWEEGRVVKDTTRLGVKLLGMLNLWKSLRRIPPVDI